MSQYQFISDPGHAWLRVPHEDLQAAGIVEDISSCSYIDTQFAYLEEDCDAPRFLDAMGIQAKDVPEDVQETTFIRELLPYTPHGLVLPSN